PDLGQMPPPCPGFGRVRACRGGSRKQRAARDGVPQLTQMHRRNLRLIHGPFLSLLCRSWPRLAAPAISKHEVNVAVEDPDAIFAAVGEVPYEWQIDTDRIAWGRNAAAVLLVADAAALDSGRGYAALIDPKSGPTRFDAVMHAPTPDVGAGVPYQLE